MRNISTPPRRKSVINVFTTPPLRRSVFSSSSSKMARSPGSSSLQPPTSTSTTYSDDEDDENTLTATGDISMSYPYYVPGAVGALSPKPQSRRGTPNLKAGAKPMMRPRPPARRLASVGAETYKFRTLTVRGGTSGTSPPSPASTLEVPPHAVQTPVAPGSSSGNASIFSISSIRTIEDEDPQLSTPQSRFAAFMKSRDLTHSPKKKAGDSEAERAAPKLEALALEATAAIGREVARPASRPLRGYAPLPARMPIPKWGAMEVDNI